MSMVAAPSTLSQALLCLYRQGNLVDFSQHLLDGLKLLIPESSVSIEEISHGSGQVVHLADRDISDDPLIWKGWDLYAYQHPGIQYVVAGGQEPILTVSELMAPRISQKLALFQEVYRRLGVKDHTVIHLPRAQSVLGIGVMLPKLMTPNQRQLLHDIYPHLLQAHQNCLASLPQEGFFPRHQVFLHTLLVTEDGKVPDWPLPVRAVLDHFFPQKHRLAWQPPAVVLDWMKQRWQKGHKGEVSPVAHFQPFERRRDQENLLIHFRRHGEEASSLLFKGKILQKTKVDPFQTLTVREKEIAWWVSQGKSNAESGIILGISPLTVKKHVERIYQKLGVENRVALTHLYLHASQ